MAKTKALIRFAVTEADLGLFSHMQIVGFRVRQLIWKIVHFEQYSSHS